MEPWRVLRPGVADSDHFDEELDPDPRQRETSDPDPHQSENSDPDPPQSEKLIRTRIEIKVGAAILVSSIIQKLCFWNILTPDFVFDLGETYPADDSHGFRVHKKRQNVLEKHYNAVLHSSIIYNLLFNV